MFRFPTSPSRRKRWLAQVKRDCWEPTTASRVCYAHFEDSSFEQKRQDGLKKLRTDAVPTVFAFRAAPKHRKPPKKRSCPVQPSCDATPATSPEPHQPLDSDSTKVDDSAPVPTLVVEEESCHAGNENAHELTSAMAPCFFPQHPNGIPVPNSTNSVGQSSDVSATHQPFGGNAGSSSVTIGQENAELRKKTSDLTRKKPVPSAYDVKCALKLICVGQFVNTPTSSSYGVDDSTHLADLLDPSFKQDQVEGQEPEELENLFVYALTTEECDILAYLGGFLLKSVICFLGECKDCERALVGDATGQ
ncbi:hypothetical protein HPB49_022063 [Dermacentor silvarum]|uniref:Uncharacterized protein n=1 Tax=Dermacentor silvarum TaxID=543639 RepID=A0ACB8D8D1_DERSI|nr:hypothetical protein HPB49_022063 [Dermacentor silvarum]